MTTILPEATAAGDGARTAPSSVWKATSCPDAYSGSDTSFSSALPRRFGTWSPVTGGSMM